MSVATDGPHAAEDGVEFALPGGRLKGVALLHELHYYFPWAMKALVKWSAFCLVTDRPMRINQDTRDYFAIGDRDDLTYEEKLAAYRALVDAFFQVELYEEFRADAFADFDERALEWFASAEFDALLVEVVRATFPADEHEAMVDRHRGLTGAWVADQG